MTARARSITSEVREASIGYVLNVKIHNVRDSSREATSIAAVFGNRLPALYAEITRSWHRSLRESPDPIPTPAGAASTVDAEFVRHGSRGTNSRRRIASFDFRPFMSAYAQVGGQGSRKGMSCGGSPGRSVRAHGPASGDDDPMLSYRVTNSAAGCRRCAPPQQIALRSSTLLRFRCLRALGPRKCKVPAGILERRVERERLLELLDGFVKPAERGERDAEIVAGLDELGASWSTARKCSTASTNFPDSRSAVAAA